MCKGQEEIDIQEVFKQHDKHEAKNAIISEMQKLNRSTKRIERLLKKIYEAS